MNSRERVQLALSHQEPDRVPIDLGGTVCSGILASAYAPLRKFFDLEDQPVRIYDIYQMLAWLEEPVIERLGIDVVMVPRLKRNWELSVDRWKPWELPDGTPVEVPRNLEVIVDDRGYSLLIYQGKPVAQMPHVCLMMRSWNSIIAQRSASIWKQIRLWWLTLALL